MEQIVFYILAAVVIAATLFSVTERHPVHAIVYLATSFFALAVIFYLLAAPLAAVFEVIIYAGAIMVLFVFVVMMLNLGPLTREEERRRLTPGIWYGPAILSGILAVELIYVLAGSSQSLSTPVNIGSKQVARSLFGPYLIAVELGSILLMAGLVGAYHLGREWKGKKS